MRIPNSTYRIQFNSSFDFSKGREIIPYLADLGISDIYASPVLAARKGSQHGYDVIDPNRINPELGTPAQFDNLVSSARARGLGWLQDIVPNHMAFDSGNVMLMDILENGTSSAYFEFFDIDWGIRDGKIEKQLLIPLLGTTYAAALEAGELQLKYDEAGLSLNYYELRLPMRLETQVKIFERNLAKLEDRLGRGNPDFIRFLGDLEFLRSLPARRKEGSGEKEASHGKKMLWTLYKENLAVRDYIDESLAFFSGKKGEPASFDELDKLISEQLYKLSFWKVATEELNYRRFFTINELISVRLESEPVFRKTHELILRLVKEGKINGLRIDHIDGLHDPTGYLQKLKESAGDLYIVVEKILQQGEELPSFWPVQGTTGYDFMNQVGGLFCRPENEKAFDKIYGRFTDQKPNYEDLVWQKKRIIIGQYMAGDIDNLARALKVISSRDRHGSDITLYGLRRALVEVMSFFPVYRTYINDRFFRRKDEFYIKSAIDKAKAKRPELSIELGYLEKFLLLENHPRMSEEDRQASLDYIMSFQQYTGPLMAKGFEDTVLYVYTRLMSLNEVGSEPHIFGNPSETFHEFNRERAEGLRHTVNATSTHDTKRGEDARARINVLSEIPQEWEGRLRMWHNANKSRLKGHGGLSIPDENDEYFFYQTLLGSFPGPGEMGDFVARLKSYIVKAVKEAKVHTAWIKPDTEYEEKFAAFAEGILTPGPTNHFMAEFTPFFEKVAFFGALNSLSQTLLKITSPGVPDIYQGSELWDLSMVDPDNRRPVDFEKRKAYLDEIKSKSQNGILGLIRELTNSIHDGRIKMFLIYRALQARQKNAQMFRLGTYIPLETAGKYKDHVIAFARVCKSAASVTVVPRFMTSLVDQGSLPLGPAVWGDTVVALPENMLLVRNAITDQKINCKEKLPVGEALRHFPAALLFGSQAGE